MGLSEIGSPNLCQPFNGANDEKNQWYGAKEYEKATAKTHINTNKFDLCYHRYVPNMFQHEFCFTRLPLMELA